LASNTLIRPKTRADIDQRVSRILRGLGNPEPPLDLQTVRELLRLDLEYYRADDPSVLHEVVSRIRVAGKQVLKRPSLLYEAIRKFDLRALYIPDQKRILIDSTQPKLKHRWSESHEIGHSILPWHEGAMLGDNQQTLLPHCHEQLEAEANFAAGLLLFLQDQFERQALDHMPTIASVKNLKPIFGNTYTTTFWRCVEAWGSSVPIVGLVTDHPHLVNGSVAGTLDDPCKHLIRSEAFAAQFSGIKAADLFSVMQAYCAARKGGPLGATETWLTDDNGDQHCFHFESFSFHYQVLTLGTYRNTKHVIVSAAS
jgi:hypothetical protein